MYNDYDIIIIHNIYDVKALKERGVMKKNTIVIHNTGGCVYVYNLIP